MLTSPVVHVAGGGNLANQMIRAMTAISIAKRVEGCRISGVSLPEWDIVYPGLPRSPGPIEEFAGSRLMKLDVGSIIQRMRMGKLQRVEITCYAQHMSNFLPVEFYRTYFKSAIAGPVIQLSCKLR